MSENDKLKIRKFLFDAIDKATEKDEFMDIMIPMHWGENTVSLAADSAANVLIACFESQMDKEKNN